MKTKIPSTYAAFKEASAQVLKKTLISDKFEHDDENIENDASKHVWHYQYQNQENDFICVSYPETQPLIDCLGKGHARNFLNIKMKNEFFAYKFLRILEIDVPDHALIYDRKTRSNHIILEYIDGQDPREMDPKDRPDDIPDKARFYAAMVAIGRWDVAYKNMLFKEGQFIHFDFDEAFNNNQQFKNKNAEQALTLLNDFKNNENFMETNNAPVFSNNFPSDQEMAKAFTDTKNKLATNQRFFTTDLEKELYKKTMHRCILSIIHLRK